jgi:hypothetical protein
MDEVMMMYPLMRTYSRLLEAKYVAAESVANRLAVADEDSVESRNCELELDSLLNGLIEITSELKTEYGIGIFDPVTGALKIPVYGKDSRSLVFCYFDSESERDEKKIRVKETEFGAMLPGLVPWTQS